MFNFNFISSRAEKNTRTAGFFARALIAILLKLKLLWRKKHYGATTIGEHRGAYRNT